MIDFKKLLEKSKMNKSCYVDTETTGTDPKKHGIIQWSGKILIDGKLVDEIDLKIQPFPNDEINDEALEHNGIKREQLFEEVDRIVPKFAHMKIVQWLGKHVNKFSKTDKFFWKGYRADFDNQMTREFFLKAGDSYFGSWFWVPALDIMALAGFLLQGTRSSLENFKLGTVYAHFYPDEAARYKAMKDADPSAPVWHDALFDIDRTIDLETALRGRIMQGIDREKAKAEVYKALLLEIHAKSETSLENLKKIESMFDLKQGELV